MHIVKRKPNPLDMARPHSPTLFQQTSLTPNNLLHTLANFSARKNSTTTLL